MNDFRYALRGLRRTPAFAAVAILSLALGIGANTAIFTLLDAVMLRPLAVSRPHELVEFLQKYPGEPRGNGSWTWTSYEHFRNRSRSFSAFTGTSLDTRAALRPPGAAPARGLAERVLPDYFVVLGVKPALGRVIEPSDAPETVAVLSWSFWQRAFAGNPAALGSQIFIGDTSVTIVGVAPRSFEGLLRGAPTDVWVPRGREPNGGLALFARLKPESTLDRARAEMAALYQFTIEERAAKSPDPLVRRLRAEVESAAAGFSPFRDRFGKALVVLMGIVGALLLLACINIAGLLLARAAGRTHELAVRIALGAGRSHLIRQSLVEALLLSGAGTVAGVVIAWLGATSLTRIIAVGREQQRMLLHVGPDGRVLAFAAALAVLTALLFGLAPVWTALRSATAVALRATGRAADTRSRRLFARGLVAAQVALSLLLVTAAAIFLGHISSLRGYATLGFHADPVLLVNLDHARAGYRRSQLVEPYREILERLHRTPGVRSASIAGATPIQGAGASRFVTVEGHTERPEDRRYVSLNWIAPRYFETLGTPLLAGRDFRFEDAARSRVAIVNRAFAAHYFAGRDPIGKRVTIEGEPNPYEIVGISGDARYTELHEPPPRTIYFNMFQESRVFSQFVIRAASGHPSSLAGPFRAIASEVVPNIPVDRVIAMSAQVDAAMVPERLVAKLSGFFGLLAAALAGIGLYGLLAWSVARRAGEIAVRMALGASAAGVVRMVLRDAFSTVAAGLLAGIPLAIAARSLATALFDDLAAPSPLPLALATIGVAVVALFASCIPAMRAARVDPMASLRTE